MTGPNKESARGDQERLSDILEAIASIASHREFVGTVPDGLVHDAVLYNLIVIGEAVGQVSEATRQKAPNIPWKKIKGLRNLLSHVYFEIRMEEIWAIVNDSLPALRAAAEHLRDDTAS